MKSYRIKYTLGLVLAPLFVRAQSAEKPNILIIQCDQFSKRVIEIYGETMGLTPILDSLANTGVAFNNSYVATPMSQPSRAGLWTGMYPHQINVRSNSHAPINKQIEPSMPTLGDLFVADGYEAVHFGKTHDMGALRGFKHTPPVLEFFKDPNYPVNQDSFMDISICKGVVGFLSNRDSLASDKPFICIADFQNPHNICGYVGAYAGLNSLPDYKGELPDLPANFEIKDWESLPLPIQYLCCTHHRLTQCAKWSDEQYQHYIAAYQYYCQMVCAQIEEVLAALHSTDAEKNTIIVFTADHGDGMASHRMVSKQTSFYEEIISVPFIISGAGIEHREELIENLSHVTLDLLPTLCGLAGIEIPQDKKGVNWAPMLKGEKEIKGYDYVVAQWHSEREYSVSPGRMLRSKDFKYIHYLEGNGQELYDLRNDKGEMNNLAYDKKYKKVLEEHREMLAEYIEKTDDDYFSLKVEVDPRCRSHKLGYQNHVGENARVYSEDKLWELVFEDNGTNTPWEENWFLDGEVAEVRNTENGIEFKSGTLGREGSGEEYNSNHGVLWSKKSFKDGIRVKYDFMRTDSCTDVAVVLFYLLAEGKGGEGFDADIFKCKDKRRVPYMKTYFNGMKLAHFSYATTLNEEDAYIRSRVYPVIPGEREFKDLEVLPSFENKGLFKPNTWYSIMVTKIGDNIVFTVTVDGKAYPFVWNDKRIEELTEGRIGFRQMKGRSSLYKNIQVFQRILK